jgi:hypothetical protein
LGAGLLAHGQHLDLTELILEDAAAAPARQLRAYRTLATQMPLWLHGTSLGLASTFPSDEARLTRCARMVEAIAPEGWSEHLAFVRVPGIEIGHLAAPPRTLETAEGAIRNLRRATQIVGAPPLVENVASLLCPPGSTLTESEWIHLILEGSGADLLLDLHNLYANAVNEGEDPTERLLAFPLERVRQVHLAGGRWIGPAGATRLDDHLHATPPEVFDLLETLARVHPGPLNVMLERDGAYPPIQELLEELALARLAVGRGRALADGDTASGGPFEAFPCNPSQVSLWADCASASAS